jgi:transposase-like protein
MADDKNLNPILENEFEPISDRFENLGQKTIETGWEKLNTLYTQKPEVAETLKKPEVKELSPYLQSALVGEVTETLKKPEVKELSPYLQAALVGGVTETLKKPEVKDLSPYLQSALVGEVTETLKKPVIKKLDSYLFSKL